MFDYIQADLAKKRHEEIARQMNDKGEAAYYIEQAEAALDRLDKDGATANATIAIYYLLKEKLQ